MTINDLCYKVSARSFAAEVFNSCFTCDEFSIPFAVVPEADSLVAFTMALNHCHEKKGL